MTESRPSGTATTQGPVTVVVVTRDRPGDLSVLLRSLERARSQIEEVVIVDDASRNPPEIGGVDLPAKILRNPSRSFLSTSRNRGAREARGRFVMFIDDDNIVDEACISSLASVIDREPSIAVASPVVYYASLPDKVWFAGSRMGRVSGLFVAMFRGDAATSIPAFPYRTELFHDAFMVRRDLLAQVGYFDELNFPMYLSEADLGARLAERGASAVVVPDAKVWHNIPPLKGAGSLLRGVHITEPVRAYFVGRNRLLYIRRHRGALAFVVHAAVFEPFYITIHLFAMVSGNSRFPWTQLFGPYLRGVLDGLTGKKTMGRKLLSKAVERGRQPPP